MTVEKTESSRAANRFLFRLLPILLIVAGAFLALRFSGIDTLLLHKLAERQEPLQTWVGEHMVAALVLYMLVYAAIVALSIPIAAVLTVTGGFLFGWLLAGTATIFAATAGAVGVFLLARGILAEPLARRCGTHLEGLRAGFQADAISYLLFLRLVPAFPFWLVNLAPAILGVRLRDFIIATILGIIPATFALALAGAGLDSVLAAQGQAYLQCLAEKAPEVTCSPGPDASNLLTPHLLAAFAALGVVALLPAIAKRLWKGRCGRG